MKLQLTIAVLAALAASAQVRAEAEEAPVSGILFASGDKKAVARVRKEMCTGPRAEVLKLFPASRYRVVPWGENRLLVVDLESGPLGRLRDGTALARVFARPGKARGVVDLAAMPPEAVEAATAVFHGWAAAPRPSALSIEPDYTVELTSGGKTLRMFVGILDPLEKARREAMKARFVPPSTTRPPVREDTAPRDAVELVFDGTSQLAMAEGAALFARTIETLQKEMEQEADAAARAMLKEMGYAGEPEAVLATDASRMPESVRKGLSQQMRDQWQVYGFASQTEAEAFLAGADSYRMGTVLILTHLTNPGDPARGIPSSGSGQELMRVPGGYLP